MEQNMLFVNLFCLSIIFARRVLDIMEVSLYNVKKKKPCYLSIICWLPRFEKLLLCLSFERKIFPLFTHPYWQAVMHSSTNITSFFHRTCNITAVTLFDSHWSKWHRFPKSYSRLLTHSSREIKSFREGNMYSAVINGVQMLNSVRS